MAPYDLKSLQLPKLYGRSLAIFADAASNPVTRAVLLGSLLENGGIPKIRKIKFSEEPTLFPLSIPETHAEKVLDYPDDLAFDFSIPNSVANRKSRDFIAAYRAGTLNPVAVAEQVIKVIQSSSQTKPALNAFLASDEKDILQQANESDQRLRNGQARSLLEGVPVAIKDEVDQTPYPTTVGTKFLGKEPAAEDSWVVSRLRAAGALLVGKTNMHEIGINPNGSNVHHGRVANPYDLNRDTGGSSSGSAAAVAAGLVPIAIGADGGGSIRIPASLCGVVGLKPTFGRVSERGAAPLCWSVAHLGPIGACVEDVTLMYSIIAGPDPREPMTLQQPPVTIADWNLPDMAGVRIGIYKDWFVHADHHVVEANEKMVENLVKAGAILVEINIPELDTMRIAHAVTILSEMAACMQNYPDHQKDFADSTRLSLVIGRAMTSHDYIQAQRMRTRAIRIFEEVFKKVDVIITPGTALPAQKVPDQALSNGWSDLSVDTELMRYVYPGNLTGLPAISFPVGYDDHGMPIAMQAMGRYWEEHLLLRVAYNAEIRFQRQLPQLYFDLLK